jgi:hypothetical protein
MGGSLYRTHGSHFFPLGEGVMPWKECSVMDEKVRIARGKNGPISLLRKSDKRLV